MKKLLLSLMLVLSMTLGMSGMAFAQGTTQAARDEVCTGVSGQFGGSCGGGGTSISGIVKTAVNVLSWVAGIAAVIMVIVAGLRYITSGGEASSISSAKNTLLYAIIGLVVVALAQFLIKFVFGRVTK